MSISMNLSASQHDCIRCIYIHHLFLIKQGGKAALKKQITSNHRHKNRTDEALEKLLINLVVFKNLCHSFNINAQALRRDTLCPIHLILMKPLKTYRQEKT